MVLIRPHAYALRPISHSLTLDGSTRLFAAHATKTSFSRCACTHYLVFKEPEARCRRNDAQSLLPDSAKRRSVVLLDSAHALPRPPHRRPHRAAVSVRFRGTFRGYYHVLPRSSLFSLQQPTAEQRIWACSSRPAIPRGVRDRGWKGAPRLFAFPVTWASRTWRPSGEPSNHMIGISCLSTPSRSF